MGKRLPLLFTLLSLLVATNGYSATKTASTGTTEVTQASNRQLNKLGGYLGLIGDPFPTLLGLNIAYNPLDFLRVTAGFGKVSASLGTAEASVTTLGFGTRFFVPGWSLSPVVGLSFANVSYSSSGGFANLEVRNFTESGSHFYGTLGVDWQAASGFNMGLGYNISFKSGVGGAPYLNFGWFFDLV